MNKILSLLMCALAMSACKKTEVGPTGMNEPVYTLPYDSSPLGSETQNGGYGLKLPSGKIVSLDLFQRASHLDPYLSSSVANTLRADERQILNDLLSHVASPAIIDLVARKFSDLRAHLNDQRVLLQTRFMILNMVNFSWVQLSDLSCLDVGDDHSPYPNKVQLAYRERRWVRFCKEVPALEPAQQAALIVHEIVYASLVQKSYVTELVGLIFNRGFEQPNAMIRSEFESVTRALQAQSGQSATEFATITDAFSVAPSVAAGIEHPQGPVCFGRGYDRLGQEIWGLWSEAGCPVGDLASVDGALFRRQGDLLMSLSGLKAGTFSGNQLTKLCNEEFTALCSTKLVPGASAFRELTWNESLYPTPHSAVDTPFARDGLHSALVSDNLDRIRYLLAHGANANLRITSPSISYDSAIVLAFDRKKRAVLQLFVDAGADVNLDHLIPKAIASGDLETLNILLTSPAADPNLAASAGAATPLDAAMALPNRAMARALLTRGADPHASEAIFRYACDPEALTLYASSPRFRLGARTSGIYSYWTGPRATLFQTAVAGYVYANGNPNPKCLETLRMLKGWGADPDQLLESGVTPLWNLFGYHLISSHSSPDSMGDLNETMAGLLIELGADPNFAPDGIVQPGYAPIHLSLLSSYLGDIRGLRFWIAHGADLNQRIRGPVGSSYRVGDSPLMLSIQMGSSYSTAVHQHVVALVDAGANLNARNQAGDSILHLANSFNILQITRDYLVAHGALLDPPAVP